MTYNHDQLVMRYFDEIPPKRYLHDIQKFIMRYHYEIQPWPTRDEILWWDTCFKEIRPWHAKIHHEIPQWDTTMTNTWWDTLMTYKFGRVLNTLPMRYLDEILSRDTSMTYNHSSWDTTMRYNHDQLVMRYLDEILERDTSMTYKNSSWDTSMRYNYDQHVIRYLDEIPYKRYLRDMQNFIMKYLNEIQPRPTRDEILWWDTNSVECWTHFLWDTMMRYLLWHTSMTYKNSSWDTPMRYNHDHLVMRYFDEIL